MLSLEEASPGCDEGRMQPFLMIFEMLYFDLKNDVDPVL